MSIRTALVSVAVLVAVGAVASSQPQPAPTPLVPRFEFPTVPPAVSVPVPPPPPPSVEQLLDALERIQAQKAAIEKQEQELKAAIRKKLEAQAERLKKLGVAPQPAKEAEPDRVGQITIEGNTKTPDKTIRNMLSLFPGQVLKYPQLEESRKTLEKYGFLGVTVEVVPGEADSHFKDVRVKVTEPSSP